VEFFTEHLADVSRAFRGDLQQVLLLATVGQMTLRALSAAAGGAVSGAADSITASRLADVTGIPRETARRKLALLAARGWIEADDAKGWRIARRGKRTAKVREDLAGLDRRGVERALRLHLAFAQRLPPVPGRGGAR